MATGSKANTSKTSKTAQLVSEDDFDAGRDARKRVARSDHADWVAGPDRDPIAILEGQSAARIQDLVPIRYGRMAVSAFAFYRGAAAVMAADLAPTPATGIIVQTCGDAHISNYNALFGQTIPAGTTATATVTLSIGDLKDEPDLLPPLPNNALMRSPGR